MLSKTAIIMTVAVLFIFIIITGEYISYLKRQNDLLANNFNIMTKNVMALDPQGIIEQLNFKRYVLNVENSALTQQIDGLKNELNQAIQEKECLKAQIDSILKRNPAAKGKANLKDQPVRSDSNTGKNISGNRGFLIKDGLLSN